MSCPSTTLANEGETGFLFFSCCDWKYEGEGGKHAIFRYYSSSSSSKELNGCLLRVDKTCLAVAASSLDDSSNNNSMGSFFVMEAVTQQADHHILSYYSWEQETRVLIMCGINLSPYVDLPRIVRFDATMAHGLWNVAISSGKIPERRQRDWNYPPKEDPPVVAAGNDEPCNGRHVRTTTTTTTTTGQLLPDYRLWQNGVASDSNQCTNKCSTAPVVVSVEIKPKAGYLAISPLVDPQRRAKYQTTRFQLVQQLARTGHFIKPWADGVLPKKYLFETSLYCPLDLFSGNGDRIRQAVYELIQCPQNNLKVWRGREAVLDARAVSPEWNTLMACLGITGVEDHGSARDRIVDMVSTILEGEPCLESLLKLQKLDILDADGAVLVYQRLVDLCQGSHEKAQALLDTDFARSQIDGSLLEIPDGDICNLQLLGNQVRSFSQLLKSTKPSLPSIHEMDTARAAALHVLQDMSVPECVSLLHNWLLSLSMCDVSLFLSLHRSDEPLEMHQTLGCRAQPSSQVVRVQQCESPGILSVRTTETECRRLNYRVRIIDYDKKPAKKLQTRSRQECCLNGLIFEN
jgi:hypothetical protein